MCPSRRPFLVYAVCLMPYHEHGTDGYNCSWPIIAAAYDFSQQVVQDWFLENIMCVPPPHLHHGLGRPAPACLSDRSKPTMTVADGVWLDGDGPDNGAWMCSGSYGEGFAGSPLSATP